MKESKYISIVKECLDEMYRKSDPPITWDEYFHSYVDSNIPGYQFHYLDEKVCKEIWMRHKKRLPEYWQTSFSMEIMNFAPTSKKGNDKK